MKIKLFLLLFFQFAAFSQTAEYNFFLSSKEVYWQKTYSVPNTSVDDLIKIVESNIIQSLKIENIRYSENMISFYCVDSKIDLKEYNLKALTTPIFLQSWQNYICVVDFKDDKYRITIKEIYFTNKQIGFGGFNDSFNSLILHKNGTEFKSNKTAKTSFELLDSFYDNSYNPSNFTKQSNDW